MGAGYTYRARPTYPHLGLGLGLWTPGKALYRPGAYMGAICPYVSCMYLSYIFVASFHPHSSLIMQVCMVCKYVCTYVCMHVSICMFLPPYLCACLLFPNRFPLDK
jgi:hypothetical protein